MSLQPADDVTVVIGAGLTGLSVARRLIQEGKRVHIVEARNRVGGRVHTTESGMDLGPAWYWPGQDRMSRLISELGLSRFDQFASGDAVFESHQHGIQRGRGFASMAGSYRINGGLTRLAQSIANDLPDGALSLGQKVVRIEKIDVGVRVSCAGQSTFDAARVIVALPPRVTANLSFDPILPSSAIEAMTQVPTWMAGQAKAVITYETPFWREAGLSGDAASHIGPMVEMHDASASDGAPFAIFGFLGVPPTHRKDANRLKSAIQDQMTRMFGPAAKSPLDIDLKDWAFDPLTATELDLQALTHHPAYGRPDDLNPMWDNRLFFGASELADDFGGYLEGALACAENLLEDLL